MSSALDDRAVLVTGAGQGIGAAIALHAAAAGARVAVNDLVPERAEQTVSRIFDKGGSAVSIAGDIASRGGSAEVVERAVSALGGLDGLVNNAGVVRFGTLRSSTDEDWDQTMAVDFSAVAYMCKSAFEPLSRKGGAIANVSSIAALFPSVTAGSYSPAKAAVVSLTKQLALEWGPFGIRSNAVGPGMISGTSMTELADADADIAARRDEIVPLRRTGRPDDVADVVVFLLSDAARYVTGQLLLVDGGLSNSLVDFIPRPTTQDRHREVPDIADG